MIIVASLSVCVSSSHGIFAPFVFSPVMLHRQSNRNCSFHFHFLFVTRSPRLSRITRKKNILLELFLNESSCEFNANVFIQLDVYECYVTRENVRLCTTGYHLVFDIAAVTLNTTRLIVFCVGTYISVHYYITSTNQ